VSTSPWEELFGPVAAVTPSDTDTEAMQRAARDPRRTALAAYHETKAVFIAT
jgi:acyl-CoA reductase-like NAD-dependent aldehyde dehydrogenase